MDFKKKKTPIMKGKESELTAFFLNQIKRWKGLTTAIEKVAGINGKWTNPNKPYELNATKGYRMIVVKILFLDLEEYIQDALEFREFVLEFCEDNGITLDRKPQSRRKQ